MKKFQIITIPMASASVAFLASTSADALERCAMLSKTRAMGGSTKCRIGIRIRMPAALTTKNMPNWCRTCRERDSGYVQKRFRVKLLITAQINEIVPA